MSRRSIFLLAAVVVALYFTIILFMLSPLHGSKSAYGYINHLSLRQVPNVNWCKDLRWRMPPSPHVTALVSFPGSGNTWLRYLLQQATGIVTGSIYMDYGLRVHGFPAENVTDGSVLVVKTHEAPPLEQDKFKSAILLIRNPRDAILADFNRLHKGHIGTAPKSAFQKKSGDHQQTDWARFVAAQLRAWEALYGAWLRARSGAALLVHYERLAARTRPALAAVLRFLNHSVSEADMDCVIKNKEGIYRRRKKLQDFDPFTPDMYKAIDEAKSRMLLVITEYARSLETTDENYLDK